MKSKASNSDPLDDGEIGKPTIPSILREIGKVTITGGMATAEQVRALVTLVPHLLKHAQEGQAQEAQLAETQLNAYLQAATQDKAFWAENVDEIFELYKRSTDEKERERLFAMLRILQDRFAETSAKLDEKVRQVGDTSRQYKVGSLRLAAGIVGTVLTLGATAYGTRFIRR